MTSRMNLEPTLISTYLASSDERSINVILRRLDERQVRKSSSNDNDRFAY
jgi:hypothetical protein